MILVAGHLCLDVFPTLAPGSALAPGRLIEVGRASFAAGGVVANVGQALRQLGLDAVLLGRTGADPFGAVVRALLEEREPGLSAEVAAVEGESTSYSIVISPPGLDRTLLHHSGCNDTFDAAQVDVERWADARLIHFGYPPLMRRVYADGGASLAATFARFRERGVTVSLDMAMPDASGPSGRVDWPRFLATVLPHVDMFLPSWSETWALLEPGTGCPPPTASAVADMAERLLGLGPALVGLKLGERGFYVRTAGSERVQDAGRLVPRTGWASREALSPNFEVDQLGTTGAGDATIAGFVAGMAHGLDLEGAMVMASAVGASSVEGLDAVGGISGWRETAARVAAGWRRRPSDGWSSGAGEPWRSDDDTGLLHGPADPGRGAAGLRGTRLESLTRGLATT